MSESIDTLRKSNTPKIIPSSHVSNPIRILVAQLIQENFFKMEAHQFLTDIAPFLDKFAFNLIDDSKIARIDNSKWKLTNNTHELILEYFTPRNIEVVSFKRI